MKINYTSSGIPKIIHQTWKTKEVPDHWKKSKDEWQRLHPDWLYILWTDEDIRNHIKDHHPDFLELHDNYEYNIQRADMIRYFILYDFGGVYSDLDFYPSENIEKYLLHNSDYFVYSSNNDTFTNSFMISRKKSPIFIEIINELKKPLPWWAIGKHLKVIKSTGPLMINNVLKNTTHLFTVLPKKKFNAYSANDDISEYKDGIILIPLEGKSWNSFDSKIYNCVMKYSTFFISLGILLLFMIIFGLIYYISKYKKCRESKVCIKP
jgi:mannosyltransferase OCH1-like enzyme